jgi:plasmid rolling circle replication initiator protein Rep
MKKVKQSKYAKKSIDDELKLIARLKEEDEKLSELMLQSNDIKIRKFGRRIADSGRIIEIDEKNGRIKRLNLSHVRSENLTSYRNKQKVAAKFYGNCDELQEKYHDNIFVSLTLTMKHCDIDELSNVINELNRGWTKLINTPEFSSYFSRTGKYYKYCGYFKSLEIGSSTEFNKINPHFHCILHIHKSFLHTKNYVSNDKLLELWKKSLNDDGNDYQISAHIKHINGRFQASCRLDVKF